VVCCTNHPIGATLPSLPTCKVNDTEGRGQSGDIGLTRHVWRNGGS